MPHKDKKEHNEYTKQYLSKPENKIKNQNIQKRNYWRKVIEAHYHKNKITDDIYDIKNKTLEELIIIVRMIKIKEILETKE